MKRGSVFVGEQKVGCSLSFLIRLSTRLFTLILFRVLCIRLLVFVQCNTALGQLNYTAIIIPITITITSFSIILAFSVHSS